MSDQEALLKAIYDNVIIGQAPKVTEAVQAAVDAEIPAGDILNKALIAAMAEVGQRFERNEFYVPEMLIAARAMQSGLNILKPLLVESGIEPIGRVAIGTVKGDLHDIGKNLVAMMMEGAGFEIKDLGTDVPADKFVAAVEEGAQIVAMSALLTTTMTNMQATIEALASAGVRDKVKIMVGGAPVTEAYAEQVGADGYAPDASSAVNKAKALLGV
jgi:5-methyltetrahydrofolate--homocysteine methyltransferase